MRKSIYLSLVCFLFLIYSINAQTINQTSVYAGFGGYNSNYKINQVNNPYKFSFDGGIHYNFSLNKEYSLLTGVEFNSRNGNFTKNNSVYKTIDEFVTIPVLFINSGDTLNSNAKNFYVTNNLGIGANLSLLARQKIAQNNEPLYSFRKKSEFGYGKAGILFDYHFSFIPVDKTKNGYALGVRAGADLITFNLRDNNSNSFVNKNAYFAVYYKILIRQKSK